MSPDLEIDKKDLALDQKTEIEVEKVEQDFDALSKITFLGNLLDKQSEIRNMLDVRTNIIIGFNSALIVFYVSRFEFSLSQNLIFLFPILAFGFSLVFAIVALKPPRFMAKKGQKESLFYHHYIDSMPLEDYRKKIHETLKNEENIYDAYVTETYNMTKYSNVPRKIYLYYSIRALIYGIILSIFAYVLLFLTRFFFSV